VGVATGVYYSFERPCTRIGRELGRRFEGDPAV
jgi:hypothetical protein